MTKLEKALNEELERVKMKEERYEKYKHLLPRLEEGICRVERAVLNQPLAAIKDDSRRKKALLRLEYKINRTKMEYYTTFLI